MNLFEGKPTHTIQKCPNFYYKFWNITFFIHVGVGYGYAGLHCISSTYIPKTLFLFNDVEEDSFLYRCDSVALPNLFPHYILGERPDRGMHHYYYYCCCPEEYLAYDRRGAMTVDLIEDYYWKCVHYISGICCWFFLLL